jgi:hypothetical protein
MDQHTPALRHCAALQAFVSLLTFVLLTSAPHTASGSPYGVNAHIPSAEVLDEITAAGIGWIRIDFVWALVELDRDEFDWRRYDRLIDDTEARGLRVFATLQGTPQWATSGSLFSGVPDDPRDWQDFCYRAASRYRGRIHAWGMWNEPNLGRFWQGTRSEYIEEILIPGAHGVRAADPDVTIVAADLAHLSSGDWDDWLEQIVRDAGSVIDVVAHHVYPSGSGHWEVTEDLDEDGSWPWDPPSVREVLGGNGWFDRPFWLTETGLQSDDYGEATQAGFYTGLLGDWYGATRTRGWVARLFFYHIMDDPRFPSITFGILEAPPSMARKQAWQAYQQFIQQNAVHDAELVEAQIPAFLQPGDQKLIKLEFRNTGTTTWIGDENIWLEVRLNAVLGELTGGIVDPGGTVAPGQTLTAEYQLAVDPTWVPTTRFEAPFFARLVGPDGWHLGDAVYQEISLHRSPPPTIDRHPEHQEVVPSGSATFSVSARSDTWIAYRWRHNSVPLDDDQRLSGTNTPVLRVDDVALDLLGDYDCVVTNAAGSVASQPAALRRMRSARRPGQRQTAVQTLTEKWLRHRYGVDGNSSPENPRERSTLRPGARR